MGQIPADVQQILREFDPWLRAGHPVRPEPSTYRRHHVAAIVDAFDRQAERRLLLVPVLEFLLAF